MRTVQLAIAVAAAMLVLSVNAQGIETGPGGVRVGGGRCEQLRRACENKEALGEEGEGNAAGIVQFAEQTLTTTKISAEERQKRASSPSGVPS